MAYITCPECGKSISSESDNCPDCGYPIKKQLSNASSSKGSMKEGKFIFCPKCGVQNSDENKVCSSCDFNFSEGSNEKETCNSNLTQTTATDSEKTAFKGKAIVFSALAAIVLIMFFIASVKVSRGGTAIMQIQSVGGQTLEEAYYFELGQIYAGYALIIRALGIFFASVLVWIGLKKD